MVMQNPHSVAMHVPPAPALPPGTRFVDAFVFDVNGCARGKRLPSTAWGALAQTGAAFSASALILDATGASRGPLGLGTADGDPDAVAYPVPGRLAPVPWAPGLAQVLLGMEGALWFDPREILARVVARCRADGLFPVVACELEFCLVRCDRRGRPAPPRLRDGVVPASSGHLCVQRIEEHGAFLHALHAALAVQDIAGGALVSEYGPGQLELNLPHRDDPLRAADEAALLRRATTGVAASMGLRATFMAKPYAQHPGNGLHIHLSLADTAGENRFAHDETLLHHAIGGCQALHAESMALFAPAFADYRRLRAGAFVAAASTWGENRRDVALRIPAGARAARRIEHRAAGADASPHLAMAAVLAAVHHGVTRGLPATDRGEPLPLDLFASLARLERAETLAGYLGADFLRLFAALKRAEAAALFDEITDAEYGFYL